HGRRERCGRSACARRRALRTARVHARPSRSRARRLRNNPAAKRGAACAPFCRSIEPCSLSRVRAVEGKLTPLRSTRLMSRERERAAVRTEDTPGRPAPRAENRVLALQQAAGNRAVGQMLARKASATSETPTIKLGKFSIAVGGGNIGEWAAG